MTKAPLFYYQDGEVVSNTLFAGGQIPARNADIRSVVELLKELRRLDRTPRADTLRIWKSVLSVFDPPMTVRQVFYALVSHAGLAKTEASYNRVGYHLLKMRRLGIIPYSFIADNTRWMRKPSTYEDLDAFLAITAQTYRRMLWADQPAYVEIWCEKDALAGVLYDVTAPWDVPLMVTRGFPSDSFLHEAAEAIKESSEDKQAFIYFFGDYDPSGQSIIESTERKLRDFGASFRFVNAALTPEQIDDYQLPSRPTKRTDSRSKGWEGGSVELDALPVDALRRLAGRCIEQHIDQEQAERTKRTERLERESLALFRASLK